MGNTRKNIAHYIARIFPISDEVSEVFDQKRKLIMLYIISVVAIATLVPLGIVAYIQYNTTLGLCDHFVALFLAVNLLYIVKSGKIKAPSIIGVSIAGALFAYLFTTGGVNNTGHLWYYTFPLFSAFLLGAKGGAIATLILFGSALLFLGISPQNSEFFTTYENQFLIRFMPSFLVVFAYAYTFEKLREKAQGKLVSKNAELERIVVTLREKENALQNSQLLLEKKVQERTADLVKINAELQASHERFTSVLDSIPAHIYVANMATDDILFMNKNMQDEFGLDCIGQKCWEVLRAQNERCHFCPNPKLINANGNPTGVFTWEDFNAIKQKWFLNSDRAISWVDGRLAHLQISIDVTERKTAENALQKVNDELEQRVAERTAELAQKNEMLNREVAVREQAEQTLRQSQERYRQAVENSPNPIFTVDNEGQIRSWNKACSQIFKYDLDILDRSLTTLFPNPENKLLAENMVHGAFRCEPQVDVELCYQCRDGGRRFMVSRVYPVFDPSGKIEHCVFANTDITARKHAELEIRRAKEEAETANRAKSEFLANMSHELRTPLNHIIGFTEMVVDKRFGDLNTRQQTYLNNVLQSGWHLLSLVNDILDLSKVEAGKLELVPGPVNLKHLLQNSLVMVKEKAAKHGIRLSQDVDGIPDSITADERKLKQILYNLLSNAVKFTFERGSVQCNARLSDENGNIEISVADTGIGIQPDDLKRIFDPFEQVEGSMSRRFEGTGLGLSLTKKLVELHGGKIWAESDGAGKGAAFRFTIPTFSVRG